MKVFIILVLAGVCFSATTNNPNSHVKPGGLVGDDRNEPRPADDNVKKIILDLTPDITKKITEKKGTDAKKCEPYEAIKYKTQVVAGQNYFVRVKTACGEFYDANIYQDLQKHIDLTAIDGPKSENDKLEYFQ